MTQPLNTLTPGRNKGDLTTAYGGSPAAFQGKVSDSESTALVPAQAVKIVDVAGELTTFTAATATTDAIFGFVPSNVKTDSYAAQAALKVSGAGTVMVMEASAAIAAGAQLEYVPTGQKVATVNTGTVIGRALTPATADGDLIRVLITTA